MKFDILTTYLLFKIFVPLLIGKPIQSETSKILKQTQRLLLNFFFVMIKNLKLNHSTLQFKVVLHLILITFYGFNFHKEEN